MDFLKNQAEKYLEEKLGAGGSSANQPQQQGYGGGGGGGGGSGQGFDRPQQGYTGGSQYTGGAGGGGSGGGGGGYAVQHSNRPGSYGSSGQGAGSDQGGPPSGYPRPDPAFSSFPLDPSACVAPWRAGAHVHHACKVAAAATGRRAAMLGLASCRRTSSNLPAAAAGSAAAAATAAAAGTLAPPLEGLMTWVAILPQAAVGMVHKAAAAVPAMAAADPTEAAEGMAAVHTTMVAPRAEASMAVAMAVMVVRTANYGGGGGGHDSGRPQGGGYSGGGGYGGQPQAGDYGGGGYGGRPQAAGYSGGGGNQGIDWSNLGSLSHQYQQMQNTGQDMNHNSFNNHIQNAANTPNTDVISQLLGAFKHQTGNSYNPQQPGSNSQLDALADFVGQKTGQQVPVKVLQHLVEWKLSGKI